ncbi:hypothetical protein Cgig2_016339 [Carnegiea gigantea]|uniref:Transcription repressor n=1 Tax=Carnegiea gigantea TaxID=171969 RepID=A0A9Q1Q8L4_9CARY|nr:hypothetical protein Cgig2_016339 [Carnegiea gigantea]
MSSCTTRRKLVLNRVSVNLGCSCRRPRLFSSIFNPKPKPKLHAYQNHAHHNSHHSSSSTSWDKTGNSTSPSPYDCPTTSTSSSSAATIDGLGRVKPKSVAIEKDSDDPYLDFRQSMLQMIVENQIYSKDDLKELLNCFLQLNSPSLHGVIIRSIRFHDK